LVLEAVVPAGHGQSGSEVRMPKPLAELVDSGWTQALAPVAGQIAVMGDFLRAAGPYLPAGGQVLRAFVRPLSDVRVLIVGQDPYPTPGHAVGLSFSVERSVRPVPRSLQNIFTELKSDLGIDPPGHGDLSSWADQGVMLLNRVLTVAPGASASHRGKGWEAITATAIHALAERGGPLVAILWGNDAIALEAMLGTVPVVKSVHPSPLSASRGFFGSKPFSRANALLAKQGGQPIDWSLAAGEA